VQIPFLIVALGAVVRLWGIGFGLPYAFSRPDELALAGPAALCLEGHWRPPDFYYPSLYIYALASVYIAYALVTRPLSWYDSLRAFAKSRQQNLAPFLYLNRGLSALMGTLTIWWVYQLGQRVFDATVGSLAAFFLALSFLHVRDSHFGTTDVTMTGLIVLAVLLIERWRDDGTVRSAAIAGAMGGLATSVKYNGLGVAVTFCMAAIMRAFDGSDDWARRVRVMSAPAAAFALAMLTAFLVTSPYILIEWDRFIRDTMTRSAALAAPHGIELSRGWIYHARVSLPAALGWPLYVASLAGGALLLVRRFRQSVVLLAFPVAYYAVSGSLNTVFTRYSLPLVPFLALTAAWFVVSVGRWLVPASAPRLRAATITVLALAGIAPSALNTLRLDVVFTREDNRVVAFRALSSLIRQESTVYLSGGQYGRVPFRLGASRLHVRRMGFDEAAGRFTPVGAGFPDMPDWIVIQRSDLLIYSRVPAAVEDIVRQHYRLVRCFDAYDDRPGRIYDQQDAFFYPVRGLAGVYRLGPNIELYELLP
jgi:hypothetical protein